jgi:hypothetical protein
MLATTKAGPRGPAFRFCGWRRLAQPASEAGLDFTRGTVTLVVAPEEHPFPIGLRSKREARCVAEPTRRHATPLTEALHVPTPSREVVLCRKRQEPDADRWRRRASAPGLWPGGPRPIVAAGLSKRTQRFGTGTRIARARKNPRAARGGPILVRLTLGNSAVPFLPIFPAQGRIDRQSGQKCTRTGVCRSLAPAQASSGPVRRCVKAWLIWLTNG